MRRTLVLLLTAGAALGGPAAAHAAPGEKSPGELKVCGNGAIFDIFVDRALDEVELHKERREVAAGECRRFMLPKGKYAITVSGRCENNRDARLSDLAVSPPKRALYAGEAIAGARVVRDSVTTFTATWTCLGVEGQTPDHTPPPFG